MTRRDDAVDAALRLFADQGYTATSTSQIEAAMGLRPGGGGLYRHVKSKQELLEVAVERALNRRFDPPPGPFRSPADALVQAVLRLVDADPELWRLLLREARTLPIDTDAVYNRLALPAFDMAEGWVRTHIGDGPDVRGRIVVGISALLYLRICQWSYGRSPADLDEGVFTAVVERLFTEGGPAA
jgi:AcrR family transcriptional regulator